MDSSKARNSRKETYTNKNIDLEINTICTMYINHNSVQTAKNKSPQNYV